MKAIAFLPLLGVVLAGCASSSFTPYVGEQQAWPTAQGAFVKRVDGLPVIRGLPAKPYDVLGELTAAGHPDSVEYSLAHQARLKGADAVIFLSGGEQYGGTVYLPGQTTTVHQGSFTGNYYSGTSYARTSPGIAVSVRRATMQAWAIKYRITPPTAPQ